MTTNGALALTSAASLVAHQLVDHSGRDAAVLHSSQVATLRAGHLEELLALLDESGPDELVRQVRAAEAVDPDGRQWPGTKRSDDATAVYLVIDGST